MRLHDILLLDLDPQSGQSVRLEEILAGSCRIQRPRRRAGVPSAAALLAEVEVSGLLGSEAFAAAVLVSSPAAFEETAGLLCALRERACALPVLLVAEVGRPEDLLQLFRLGVSDFVTAPLEETEVLPRLWRLFEPALSALRPDPPPRPAGLEDLIGDSPAFLAVLEKIEAVAACDATVIVEGETGTGKEVCARAIHRLSPRAGKPFLPINCGALPVELVENELFGHRRSAFTGADTTEIGVIAEAEGGTLFLDEVDCLPAAGQVKLLRFLQEKEYRPLGSTRIVTADVRFIAASNCDLAEAVTAGRVREDLYYRLNVLPLLLPPLRERREDIPLLACHFLRSYAAKLRSSPSSFSGQAMHALLVHDWPGNVRELEHVVERAAILARHKCVVGPEEIVLRVRPQAAEPASFQNAKRRVVESFERSYIEALLLACEGNIGRAARAAKKNRRAFWQLMRKYSIEAEKFKSQV